MAMATHTRKLFAALAASGFACTAQAGGVYNTATTVDDGAGSIVGEYSSIAIGTDGFPVISYFDDRAAALKVAHCYDMACTQQPQVTFVDDSLTKIEGRYSSIAIGSDGFPVISYQGNTGDNLKVAHCVDLACTLPPTVTEVFNPTTITGTFTSIAIGNNDRPVVSFADQGGLTVARCANAECTGAASINVVDGSAFSVGYASSIAIGKDGFPVISYYDLSNTLLKVAKCGNSACGTVANATEVDATGEAGSYTAIAVRNNGNPVVAYSDDANGTLKIAECADPGCTSSSTMTLLALPGEVVGQHTDIALGPTGKAFISHHNATAGSLLLTVCLTADCADGTITTTLDAAPPGDAPRGEYSSLALGADNFPVMSYFDAQSGALKVAHCGTRNCDGLFHDGFDDLPPTTRPASAAP